jgi:hypothetical protein
VNARLTKKQEEFIQKYGKDTNWESFKMGILHGREITTANRLRDRWEYLKPGDTSSDNYEDWYFVWTEDAIQGIVPEIPMRHKKEKPPKPAKKPTKRSDKNYVREYNRVYARKRRLEHPGLDDAYRLKKKLEALV